MGSLIKILQFTLRDQLRQKSFYLLLGMCVVLVMLVRGCYGADMVVNDRVIDTADLALHLTAAVFQVICYAMFLMTILVSMRVLHRDEKDGAMIMFLSRPVRRWQYLLGRAAGTWLLCSVFMLILQGFVFFVTWTETGRLIYPLFGASLLASANLLFIIVLVFLLTMWLPDIMAALFVVLILGVGFVSETGHRLLHSGLFQAVSAGAPPDPATWRIFYPKVNMVQQYASTLITDGSFQGMGAIHPLANLLFYLCLVIVLSVMIFNRREVV